MFKTADTLSAAMDEIIRHAAPSVNARHSYSHFIIMAYVLLRPRMKKKLLPQPAEAHIQPCKGAALFVLGSPFQVCSFCFAQFQLSQLLPTDTLCRELKKRVASVRVKEYGTRA